MTALLSMLLIVAALISGAWLVAALDALCLRLLGAAGGEAVRVRPLQKVLQTLRRQHLTTEAPDAVGRWLAPTLYLGLAGFALALVPVDRDRVLLSPAAGIVVWGAIEALTVVAIFLHGWSQNSLFPLMGGFRFVAMGLSAMLLSMFVLIAAALPAESLALPDIVDSQRDLWNVVRQPLGLPLFLILGLTLALREPMNFADGPELAAGTATEDSGPLFGVWQLARAAMLVGFAAVAATVFLGGPLGPVLPGPLWLALKTILLLTVLISASHLLARPDASRALTALWILLLPLSFLGLTIAGLASLP